MQQLILHEDWHVYYYSNERSTAEIDFLIDNGETVIPLEVKAEENLKAKSLKTYCAKYSPQTAVRTSMSDYRQETWMVNIPLYAIQELASYI